MSYAKGTSVPVRKSRQEVEEMLERRRAAKTYTAVEEERAIIGFVLDNRHIRFELKLPNREEFRTSRASRKTGDERWEQACREAWRGLVLALKAKFTSIELGIETTEQAFLAHVVLPNKQTVGEWFAAQVLRNGDVPFELPQLGSGEARP